MWIFSFQAVAYYGKIIVHPAPLSGFESLFDRMTVGPFVGEVVFAAGLLFHGAWITLLLTTYAQDRRKHDSRKGVTGMG